MTDVASKPSWRQSRWLLPVLVASLAFNLLVLGGFAAAAWHRHGHHWRQGHYGLMSFVRTLPADRQDAVKAKISAARGEIRAQRMVVRTAMSDANALLAAEPFDADKFKVAMAKAAAEEDKLKTAIANVLADTASVLTAEERAKLKEWREERRPRWFRHGKDGKPGDGEDGDDDDGPPPPPPPPQP